MNSPAGIFAYFARGLITRPSGIQSRLPPYRHGLGCCFDNDLLRFFATSNSSPALPRKTLTHARSSLTDDIAVSFPLGLYIPSLLSSSCSVIIITKQKEGEKRRSLPKRFERDNNIKTRYRGTARGLYYTANTTAKFRSDPSSEEKAEFINWPDSLRYLQAVIFFRPKKNLGDRDDVYNDAYIHIIII